MRCDDDDEDDEDDSSEMSSSSNSTFDSSKFEGILSNICRILIIGNSGRLFFILVFYLQIARFFSL